MSDSSPQSRAGLLQLLKIWPFVSRYKTILVLALCALVFTSAITLTLGQGIRMAIDQGFLAASMQSLNQTLLFMMVLVVCMAAGTFVRFYLVTWLGERVVADIRQAVFNHLVHLHPSYFEENRSGEITSRLTTDTTLLQSIIGSSMSWALRSVITVVGALIMLMITNFKLTLIVLAAVPLVLVPILVIGRRVRVLARRSQDTVADVGAYAGEIIQQIKTVQSYAREDYEKKAFGVEVGEAFDVARQRIRQRSVMMSTVLLLAFGAICLMVWVGGRDVMAGVMSGGDLAAFVFYAIMVAFGVASVSEVMGELQRAAGAIERLLELLAVESLIQSPERVREMKATPDYHLQLDQVTFNYPSRPDRHALHELTLNIKAGETVALVGPSGAGKSTLFEILLRFYDPQQGQVLLNDVDIRELNLQQLRQEMALVPQQPVLFSTDVMTNIRYGRPDASDEEVYAAAKAAYADEFIRQLPQQYHSYLGENGVRLSGGQKQRVVIARAILNNPRILLLDEATSALDAESEHQVQKALDALMQNRTTLIIAHRLATVINADRIVVMNEGRVVAQGQHGQLVQHSPLYQRLAELQFSQGGAEIA
ncbi:ABC transporter transmembrane domain-containing protein [Gynuella sunshinyii]|uniref:ABC-type multidrug transport system, ATPase and permease component n=1 Tax=Gynuella sunshinyii YC6258 TaxID=1445510 RepID=A0A0C5W0U5_9GAMM|nr:ABC transporter transmembrane domain-containing protein [Gynuella sunshinyii]AJQ96294.1 ABC-type multidrug transport system, ATPase and permease component [Gynuella sunshinyii YC6258]